MNSIHSRTSRDKARKTVAECDFSGEGNIGAQLTVQARTTVLRAFNRLSFVMLRKELGRGTSSLRANSIVWDREQQHDLLT